MSNKRFDIEEVLMRDTEIKQNFISLKGRTWETRKFNTPIQKTIKIEDRKGLKLKSNDLTERTSKAKRSKHE